MTSLQFICDVLGRELDSEEKELFSYISPHGMAKLNSDICKGVNLEHTLSELRVVFQSMQRRRQQVESALPESAQSLIHRMNRPPSTDEMVLLADVPTINLMAKINELFQEGEEIEDIIEDLAVAHRQKQLMFDAQRLANAQGLSVSISRLAPTARPLMGNVMASNTASFRSNKIRVGLSPIVMWFEEQAREQSPASPFSAVLTMPSPITSPVSTPSHRSALRHHRVDSLLAGSHFPTQDSFSSVCLDSDAEHAEHERTSTVSFQSSPGNTDTASDSESCHVQRTPPRRIRRRQPEDSHSLPTSPQSSPTSPTSMAAKFSKLRLRMSCLLSPKKPSAMTPQ